MLERIERGDLRFLAICAALLAATTWFSVRYFHRAFPEASIDFRVNRDEAAGRAAAFLARRGLPIEGYRSASRFGFDNEAKTFLEREIGLEQANRLMGSRVRLWRWSNRWFRPRQKEEFRVDVTPAGDVAGFEHRIDEAAARPTLSPEQARAAAEDFLGTLGRDPAALEFLEASSLKRPARTDHVFTWKERGFEVHDATYRLEVTVFGNEAGGYREYLKVPETWSRSYEALRSRNQAAQSIDSALTVLLAAGLLVVLVMRIRRRDIRWRLAAGVGATGAVLLFLSTWNSFPVTEFGYPTTDSYGSFLAQRLIVSLLGALAAGTLLMVLTAAAEPLYRESMGRQLSLSSLLSLRGLRTRRFLLGTVLGIALTGIFVAYQISFYMVAQRFGAWSPADVPYDDLLNTRFPWLFVLFGGFLPAVSEEFLFRVFAIPFLRRLLRFGWVALVVAGFLWGFGHAGYPQQPFWIRGVEVGIGGVALGLIMLRWGILPALVWHYSVDAMYSALLLMRSPSAYFKLSGAASAGIMLLPVAFALFEYWRRGGFEPETGLTNAEQAGPAEEEIGEAVQAAPADAPAAGGYVPLGRGRRITALAIAGAAVAVALLPIPRFGDRPRFRLPEQEIRASAARFVKERGLDPGRFWVVAYPSEPWSAGDSLAGKYMLERRPAADVEARFERYRPLHYWIVRYYRALDQEEISVSVHPETARVLAFQHRLPEDRPGADLGTDAARDLAVAFASSRGIDTAAMDLKESSAVQRKARRDYSLVWEARPDDPRNVADAHYRTQLAVAGDRVTSLRVFWKLPEGYERARTERNLLTIVLQVLRILLIMALAVLAVGLIVNGTRRHTLRWGFALRAAAPVAGIGVSALLLGYRQVYRNYDTAIPMGVFEASVATGMVIAAVGLFLLSVGALAVLLCLQPESPEVVKRAARAVLGPDAVLFAALACAVAAALVALQNALVWTFPGQALVSLENPQDIVSPLPAWSATAGAVQNALNILVALALLAYAGLKWIRRRWLAVAAGALAVAGLVPGSVHTPGEFLLYYGVRLAAAAAVFAVCRVFARGNLLAYVLAAWTLAMGAAATELLAQPNFRLQVHAWAVLVVLLLSVVCTVWPAFRRREKATD